MNVQTEIETYAWEQLKKWNLRDWKFEWCRAKHFLGFCKYEPRIITVSKYYINNDVFELKNTVLHEIAHALAGPEAGHSNIWKMNALKVGARPERCNSNAEVVSSAKPLWTATCNSCRRTFNRHRRPKYMNSIYCAKCGLPNGILTWRNNI